MRFVDRRRHEPGGPVLALRDGDPRLESRLASVTAGNGAIYAVRREAYVNVDPIMGHDLSLPFKLVKRGWRAVYEPGARASEKMVPTIKGEFARKRRMMSHMWPIVLRGGMLSPRGYPPLYALMIGSHRVLRYVGPFLHVVALLASVALAAGRRPAADSAAALAAQAALLGAAAAGGACAPGRSWWRATTCSPRRRSPPGCGTTSATGRRRGGRRPRARAEPRRTAATHSTATTGYGMNSGPLSVNALRKLRMTASDCGVSLSQVRSFVHAASANCDGMFVLFWNMRTW